MSDAPSAPTTDELLARRIDAAGTFNMRDTGGYATANGETTRCGTLLRSDGLGALDDSGRQTLRALGVRTVIDLRTNFERENTPSQLDGLGANVLHRPIFEHPIEPTDSTMQGITLAGLYATWITERAPELVGAVRELAKTDALPALVHCTGGKDRTGLVIALALSAVGVPDDVVAADYGATNLFLTEAAVQTMSGASTVSGVDKDRLMAMMASPPELLISTLRSLRETYGNVSEFLRAHGMSGEEIGALREVLLTAA